MSILDTERPTVSPRREVANAIREYPTGRYDHASFPLRPDELARATAVLNRLHELGAFNDQFYDAIKKEEKQVG